MIEKKNLNSLFKELDDALSLKKEKKSIIIYGGAALISLGILDRATVDIDVFQPQIDETFLKVINKVGEAHSFGELWINSTGNAFVKELPSKWEDRVDLIFDGKYLTVSRLGRLDLIFTKLLAELDRQEDMADLMRLKPTDSELERIQEPLLLLEDNELWKTKVEEIIKRIKGQANGNC